MDATQIMVKTKLAGIGWNWVADFRVRRLFVRSASLGDGPDSYGTLEPSSDEDAVLRRDGRSWVLGRLRVDLLFGA